MQEQLMTYARDAGFAASATARPVDQRRIA